LKKKITNGGIKNRSTEAGIKQSRGPRGLNGHQIRLKKKVERGESCWHLAQNSLEDKTGKWCEKRGAEQLEDYVTISNKRNKKREEGLELVRT